MEVGKKINGESRGGACYHHFSAQCCGHSSNNWLNSVEISDNFKREKWKRILFCNLVKLSCNTGKYAGHEQKRCAEICILLRLPRIKLRYLNYWTIRLSWFFRRELPLFANFFLMAITFFRKLIKLYVLEIYSLQILSLTD